MNRTDLRSIASELGVSEAQSLLKEETIVAILTAQGG